ncbi:pH-response regulator protein palF/prr-3 [Rhypophila decipiens]|uniref:PH-response regulator protein palF/prr-3 n=1 Tax=Rhypophila decipiens TaxID=261697 RepID=A0AAN6YKF0_9PEZI|nr:pH-response regulator protein palF/prr-3 [Rhypophila decipiens]
MGPSRTTADNSPAAPAATASIRTSVEESSSGRSFLSRLSLLPLRSRTRNVADFYIRPAEPHRKYGAGDHVQGAVILTVVKPVRITHLTVALHGYVRVSKGPSLSLNDPVVNPAEIPTKGARPRYQGGYASLFQDEQVLSSDGRLEIGRYEFNFDLLFPSKGLPSSIDFERGTISYLITATLTRPTSISPTTSCETKIYLVDKVDVGSLSPPRPHTIYLEPISKRSKKKKAPGVENRSATSETPEPASDLDSTRANENSTEGSLSVIGEDMGHDPSSNHARSPSQIETPLQSDIRSVSGDSAASVSTGRSRPDDPIHVVYSNAGKRRHVVEARTITATIEVLKGGCIAGDIISVKVSVQHIKRIKSMHGVIVTLYRQGRIDSAPSPLLFRNLSKEDARRMEKEELYPKSKTGLGGLSLSSAGTCSVFRKDLSQAFSPLIIDPATLSASVTTSVRVPEDAFPTIKGVPGEMISFKYQIEVIVDLGGKLANQLQRGKTSGPRIGATTAPVGPVNNPYEGGVASLASWGTSIIDTDRLRREKGVISIVDEVVVGTLDSSRLRGKSLSKLVPSIRSQPAAAEPRLSGGGNYDKGPYDEPPEDEGYPQTGYIHQHDYAAYPQQQQHPPRQYPYWNPAPSQPPPPPPPQISAPHYVPPPEIPDEQNLTEKERVRRAEQRLLPSQPDEPSGVAGPSEPALPLTNGAHFTPSAPPPELAETGLGPSSISYPAAPPLDIPSTPPALDEACSPGREAMSPATEDKQELERRRLLAEASAPPEFPEDDDDAGVGTSSAAAATVPTALEVTTTPFEPSAPVLVDDDEADYGTHYTYATASPTANGGPSSSALGGGGVVGEPSAAGGHGGIEPLPRYER